MTWFRMIGVLCAPAFVFWLVGALFPTADDTPRWRAALVRRVDGFRERRSLRRQGPPDPFDSLRVQERLGVVADHVRSLEADARMYARAERIIASQLAYDQLLAEACRLAGVSVEKHAKGDPGERFREEVELASRGWSW